MGVDGTLCASRLTLSEALRCSERTVSRHVRKLEVLNAIVILKVGTANVYCLDPSDVWKSFNDAKPYAAFTTKTLIGKTENRISKRRLSTLVGSGDAARESQAVPSDIEEDVEEMLRVAPSRSEGAEQ